MSDINSNYEEASAMVRHTLTFNQIKTLGKKVKNLGKSAPSQDIQKNKEFIKDSIQQSIQTYEEMKNDPDAPMGFINAGLKYLNSLLIKTQEIEISDSQTKDPNTNATSNNLDDTNAPEL